MRGGSLTVNELNIMRDMLGGVGNPPRTIAVVGLSDNPAKPSFYVSEYMQSHGFRIIPVNPAVSEVLGEQSYASLREVPVAVDLVNVFRLPRAIPPIVDEMIERGLRDLWVQLGIRNQEAADRAENAGIRVVMDRCIMIEHRRLAAGLL